MQAHNIRYLNMLLTHYTPYMSYATSILFSEQTRFPANCIIIVS